MKCKMCVAVAVLFSLILCVAGELQAVEPAIVGSLQLDGAEGVFLSGSYAYVAYMDGVSVVDVSDPAKPVQAGFIDMHTPDLAISGNYSYGFLYSPNGLYIMERNNIQMNAEIGNVAIPGTLNGLAVSGNYAYVAATSWQTNGLYIVDVSNPANPTIVTSTPIYGSTGVITNSAKDVSISGDYAYVADVGGTINVIDISSPANPKNKLLLKCSGMISSVYVSGGIAYVVFFDNGLVIFDIRDINNPTFLGSVPIPGFLGNSHVFISGSHAYVTSISGLYIVDVSKFVSLAVPAQTDPSVSITLNQSEYRPGDRMTLTLSTAPGSGDNLRDVYVALVFPDGSLYFISYDPAITASQSPTPARPLRAIEAESKTILDFVLPEGLPEGNWTWAAVLAAPDLSEIGQVSSAPFTFSAAPPTPEAPSVAGTWTGTWQSASTGVTGSFTAMINQQGSTLSGTITVPFIGMYNVPLKGSYDGTTISFGDVNSEITFNGSVSGGTSASGSYIYPALGDSGSWIADKTPGSPASGNLTGTYRYQVNNPALSGDCGSVYQIFNCSSPSNCFFATEGSMNVIQNNTAITLNLQGDQAPMSLQFQGTTDSQSFLASSHKNESEYGCTVTFDGTVTGNILSVNVFSGNVSFHLSISGDCMGMTMSCTITGGYDAARISSGI